MKDRDEKINLMDPTNLDVTLNTECLQLKYNNPDGESTNRFRYSNYLNESEKKLAKDLENKTKDGIWMQTKLMVWKNYLVSSRNLKTTIFQVFVTPVLMCLILISLQSLLDDFSESLINKNPEVFSLPNVDRCEYPSDCLTIGYGIIVNTF